MAPPRLNLFPLVRKVIDEEILAEAVGAGAVPGFDNLIIAPLDPGHLFLDNPYFLRSDISFSSVETRGQVRGTFHYACRAES